MWGRVMTKPSVRLGGEVELARHRGKRSQVLDCAEVTWVGATLAPGGCPDPAPPPGRAGSGHRGAERRLGRPPGGAWAPSLRPSPCWLRRERDTGGCGRAVSEPGSGAGLGCAGSQSRVQGEGIALLHVCGAQPSGPPSVRGAGELELEGALLAPGAAPCKGVGTNSGVAILGAEISTLRVRRRIPLHEEGSPRSPGWTLRLD